MEKKNGIDIKYVVIIAVASLILGALIMFLLNCFAFNKNNPVVSIKGLKLTKIDLYEKMKKDYGLSFALEEIDNKILEYKYPTTDEMKKEVEEEANGYITTYEMYGYSKEDFLSMYGYKSYEDFLNDVYKNHRLQLFYNECLEEIIGEEQIKEYYDTEGNVYGAINCKHILVEITDDITEEQAKKLAETIIDDLKSGSSWEDVIEKHSDNIITEDLGYQGFDNNLEDSFMDALKAMDNNSYSKEPVKTSYGYHVIYRLDQNDKPSYEDAKEAIIEKLSYNLDQDEIDNPLYKLEEEYGIKFYDEELNKKYEELKNDNY